MAKASHLLKIWRKELLILLFLAGSYAVFRHYGLAEYLSFEYLKEHRRALHTYVQAHYGLSVLVFGSIYIAAALFLPGAIVLTLAAGYLFGVIQGVIYVNLAATTGAVISLLLSRHLIGNRVQKHYGHRLTTLNRLLERHGAWYLIVLRVIPVLPFFAINYLLGVTRIRLSTFVLATLLGMLPGSVILAYAGKKLAAINSLNDVWSTENLLALGLLALFCLLAPAVHYYLKLPRNRYR